MFIVFKRNKHGMYYLKIFRDVEAACNFGSIPMRLLSYDLTAQSFTIQQQQGHTYLFLCPQTTTLPCCSTCKHKNMNQKLPRIYLFNFSIFFSIHLLYIYILVMILDGQRHPSSIQRCTTLINLHSVFKKFGEFLL